LQGSGRVAPAAAVAVELKVVSNDGAALSLVSRDLRNLASGGIATTVFLF
jgi:hypothetical protein